MLKMKIPTSLILRCSSGRITFATACCESQRYESTSVLDPVSHEALNNARPFAEIPGPKALPLIGTLHQYMPIIGNYSLRKWHEAARLKHQIYGPIFREEMMFGFNIVQLCDPKDLENVHRHEGKLPCREFFASMKKIREQNREMYSSVGMAAGNGEEWYDIRRRAQKSLMRPQIMNTYLPQMNVIADDMIRRMRMLKQPNNQVPDFMNELLKWALESITYIFFNERMGCLADNLPADSMAQEYIEGVDDFFNFTGKVELSALPLWRLFPSLSLSFRKLKKVHDFFFETAMLFVKKRLDEIKDDSADKESLLQLLLKDCSPKSAGVVAVDAMAAGIDTTALTVAYVLRNLAVNPQTQIKLQEEVDRVLPKGAPLTVQTLDNMPYLKACLKESMRITPTAQGISRVLDKEIVMGGYRVPAGVPFMMNYYISSVDENYFPDALKYKPERWLRSGPGETVHNFAHQPFGFGPRMCVGKRIADLEMLTLLTKLMQNFWIENKNDELDIDFQLVLMIKNPLRYEFYERYK